MAGGRPVGSARPEMPSTLTSIPSLRRAAACRRDALRLGFGRRGRAGQVAAARPLGLHPRGCEATADPRQVLLARAVLRRALPPRRLASRKAAGLDDRLGRLSRGVGRGCGTGGARRRSPDGGVRDPRIQRRGPRADPLAPRRGQPGAGPGPTRRSFRAARMGSRRQRLAPGDRRAGRISPGTDAAADGAARQPSCRLRSGDSPRAHLAAGIQRAGGRSRRSSFPRPWAPSAGKKSSRAGPPNWAPATALPCAGRMPPRRARGNRRRRAIALAEDRAGLRPAGRADQGESRQRADSPLARAGRSRLGTASHQRSCRARRASRAAAIRCRPTKSSGRHQYPGRDRTNGVGRPALPVERRAEQRAPSACRRSKSSMPGPCGARWPFPSIPPWNIKCPRRDCRKREAVPEFIDHWGTSDSPPEMAFRLNGNAAEWSLVTRARRAETSGEQHVNWSFNAQTAELQFDAQLTTAGGSLFQYRLDAPPTLHVDSIAVLAEGVNQAARWSQDPDGQRQRLSRQPLSGRHEIQLHGQMPLPRNRKLGDAASSAGGRANPELAGQSLPPAGCPGRGLRGCRTRGCQDRRATSRPRPTRGGRCVRFTPTWPPRRPVTGNGSRRIVPAFAPSK